MLHGQKVYQTHIWVYVASLTASAVSLIGCMEKRTSHLNDSTNAMRCDCCVGSDQEPQDL